MRVSLHSLPAVLYLALMPLCAHAQGASDADAREVLAYRLTMPKLKQFNDVLADVSRQRDADPARQALMKKKQEMEALSAKDQLTQEEQARLARLEREIEDAEDAADDAGLDMDMSLSQMADRMSTDPHISAALKRAGLTPREAATLQLAYVQAALTVSLLEAGTIHEVPKEVNAGNVKFLQDHKDEISALKELANREG